MSNLLLIIMTNHSKINNEFLLSLANYENIKHFLLPHALYPFTLEGKQNHNIIVIHPPTQMNVLKRVAQS